MSQYTGPRARPVRARGLRLTVGVALGVALAACGGQPEVAATDSTPVTPRDVALLRPDSAAPPQLADVPVAAPAVAPAPAAPSPTPRPAPAKPAARPAPRPTTASVPAPTPAPTPATGQTAGKAAAPDSALPLSATLPVGTTLRFTAARQQCTNTLRTGDRLTAALAAAVPAGNGIALPAGATGVFEVVEARTATSSGDSTALQLRLVALQTGGKSFAVNATTQEAAIVRVRSASKGEDLRKVAGGALAGAIAGRLLGKSTRSTVVGAAAGAAAGTAAAAATGNFDSCLQEGGTIAVRLEAPLTVFAPAVY